MNFDEFREYLVEGLQDDWLYFAELLWVAQEINGPSEDIPQQALDAAVFFIREGLIVPGDIVSAPGFTPWSGGQEEWVARLQREVGEMIAQGVEPTLGDVCWFDFAKDHQPEQNP